MKKIAISQLTTLRWNLQQDIEAAVGRGIGGLGLWRPKVDDFGVESTAESMFSSGLRASSLSWVGGFTGSDGRRFSDAVDDAIDAIQQADALGAETLIVLTGGRNNHIRRHLHKTICQALVEINAVALSHGVALAIEPFHPGCGDEWSFLHDIRATLDIVAAVGSDNIGLVLDTYHLGMDEDVLTWLPDVIAYLELVQVGDSRHCPLGEMNRCLLGEGQVPIPEILETLASGGYDRWLEIEVLGQDVEPLTYDTVLDHSLAYLNSFRDPVEQT
jgi:sugar phosphate isomerase/epimerase